MPIRATVTDRIAEVLLDHPPVNAFDSAGWAQLAETTDTGTIATTAVSTTTDKSAFVNILPAAKADVCLRLWHTTGDSSDDIAFRILGVELR